MGEVGAALVGSRGGGLHTGATVQGCILAFLWVGVPSRNQRWVRLCWVVRKAPEGTALQSCALPPAAALPHGEHNFPGVTAQSREPSSVLGQEVSLLPGMPQPMLPALVGAWSSCTAASAGASALPALLPSPHVIL